MTGRGREARGGAGVEAEVVAEGKKEKEVVAVIAEGEKGVIVEVE